MLRVMEAGLADLEPEALRSALERYVLESETRWWPAVGLMRRYVSEAAQGVLPGWAPAWDALLGLAVDYSRVRYAGGDAAIRFHQERVPEGLRPWVKWAGGFPRLLDSDPRSLEVMRSNFRDAWTREAEGFGQKQKLPEVYRPELLIAPAPVGRRAVENLGAALALPHELTLEDRPDGE